MGRFLSPDRGIIRFLMKATDCVLLCMLFIISSVPIFTIGASLTATYYVIHKVIRHDRGYLWKQYWGSWGRNFKQATVMWLLMLLIGGILGADIWVVKNLVEEGTFLRSMFPVLVVLLVVVIGWCIYIFPYLSRFDNSTKAILKNSFFISILNLPKTLLLLVNLAVFGVLLYIVPLTAFIVPAVYMLVKSLVLDPVFRKYMTEEDRAIEDEWNREYS